MREMLMDPNIVLVEMESEIQAIRRTYGRVEAGLSQARQILARMTQ